MTTAFIIILVLFAVLCSAVLLRMAISILAEWMPVEPEDEEDDQ